MPPLQQSSDSLTADYDAALLDLDGVVYIGPDAVPGVVQALNDLDRSGRLQLTYVTNNAARSSQAVAQHLCELGLRVLAADVVTSAQAAAALLATLVPRGSRVFVLGSRDLMREVEAVGLTASQDVQQEHAALVQGYWPDLPWRLLAHAAGVLHTGVPWVATNLDLTIPTPWGAAPGNGAMVQALMTATGRQPTAVAGKPEAPLLRYAVERAASTQPLVVGDRLDTDIAGANNVGIDSLLVLSGVTSVAELLAAPEGLRPTYLAWDATGLESRHRGVALDEAAARLGEWTASGGRLSGMGDVLDAIRVAAVAVWHGLLDIDQASAALRARGVAVG